jgi:hypothetical protein
MINLKKYGKIHPMTFELANYADNATLYVGLLTNEEGYPEPWQNLTVNLNESRRCKPNCAYIDTNNNGDEIITWLEENGLGEETGRIAASGWCFYPEFEFNMEALMKHVVNDKRIVVGV